MIVLQLLQANLINVELKPTIVNPNWLFVFVMDDLKGNVVKSFIEPNNSPNWYNAFTDDIVPGLSWNRFYNFTVDTSTVVLKTGEWVLSIYEMEDQSTQDVTGLIPQYISKVKLYKTLPTNAINVLNLSDARVN